MRRHLPFLLFLCACQEPPQPPFATPHGGDTPAVELQLRPAGKRTYDLIVRERIAFERRGAAAGAGQVDLRVDLRVTREDAPAEGGGLTVRLTYDRVLTEPRGVLSSVAARAAQALAGAVATYEVGPRGDVKRFSFTGAETARPLAELMGRGFLRMSPTFSEGPKGIGARWGETSNIPLEVGEGQSAPASFTASYSTQGMGRVSEQPCLLVEADLRVASKAPAPGAKPGAVSAGGNGKAHLCVDPQSGALRAGILELTLRTAIGLRQAPAAPPLHLEQILRLRMEAREAKAG
jgi:hypothetical protein